MVSSSSKEMEGFLSKGLNRSVGDEGSNEEGGLGVELPDSKL